MVTKEEYLEELRKYKEITGEEFSEATILKHIEEGKKIKEHLRRKEKTKGIMYIIGIIVLFILIPILAGIFAIYPK